MQVTETQNEGLKRAVKVVVPAQDMEKRLAERLETARGKARINGFRPGKVPTAHLRKMYGKSFMAELVNEIISEQAKAIPAGRGEKVAMQPHVEMTEDEKLAGQVLEGKADFEFSVSYEVLPKFDVADVSKIEITRPIVEIADAEIEEQVQRIAESAKTYTEKKGKGRQGRPRHHGLCRQG